MCSVHAKYVTDERIDGVSMGYIDPDTDVKDVLTCSKLNEKVFAGILKYFKST